MDVTKEISFMELMEVDGVRKHILKCFEKFSDIENLTKTCRCLCLLINRDKIWRDIMWFHDYPYLTVKYDWGFIKADETRILENIDIIKTKCSCKELAKGSRYYGETVTNKKQTYFTINLDIGINIPEEHTTLVQGIAEECMLNHQLRSDVEILYFENSCDIQQRSLLIECLSYMKHDSVKRIILSVNILQNCQCLRNPNVWARDIFGGFPNLNEVVFYRPGENYQNYGFFGNGSTIKYIIKSLGKKRNGTIIFEDARYDDNDLVRNVEKIYGYCDRHGVRIKLEFGLRNNSNIKNFINITSHGNARFSIDNLITRHSLPINYSTPFLESVEIFSLYENLEKLVINFSDLTIINNIKDTCLSNLERYSLRNCRKLKSVELNYFDEDGEYNDYIEKMLESNLIFIASLMPDTVERLKISRNFNLSSRITDKLNECIPNIKLLTFYNGEIKNSVCLSAFRNLELFITGGRRRNIFEIPKTIKCIVLNHRFFYTDNRNMNFKKELVRRCCESFLKYSRTNEGTYIFFNDVTQWGKYKRLVQECLY